MTIRTPNYVLVTSITVPASTRSGESKTLPAGSFVRPIELAYIPKHVLENDRAYHDPELDVYCYTRYGIVSISRRAMRET